MNLLGKIFVVTLLVMSVVFMTLAVQVYTTHRDWKSKADQAQKQLTQARANLEAEKRKFDELESRLRAENNAAVSQAIKLENERVRLEQLVANTQAQLNDLSRQQRQNVAAVNATQQANNQLADDVTTLRRDILDTIAAKDRTYGVALKATEELQSLRNELETAMEVNTQLVADTGRMAGLLRENNLDPETPVDAIVPRVDGFVSKTQRKNGVQLVEISIGSDDGLKPGHTVEVFRNTKYKGRLEILKTAPDRAVGRVDSRFQQGPIQEGDRVATRLKLG